MAVFQSQKDKPTKTERTKQAVAYFDKEITRPPVESAIDRYHRSNRDGDKYTLACLEEVGEAKLRAIAAKRGKSFDLIKQHFGIWVAIILADMYGPGVVFTYRRFEGGPNSARKVPDDWRHVLPWVSSYTPHKVEL